MALRLRNKYGFYFIFSLIVVLGLWLRFKNIDQRPMHGDEANQAYRFQMLFEKNEFKYEPKDFHGPTLYYLTLPFAWLGGLGNYENSTKGFFRGVTVFFSLLTCFASLLFVDILGRKGVLAMALFLMVSPAMVYYSTYYIQETLLVCFTLFFMGCGWRLWRRPSLPWAIGGGLSLGLMHATKETFVIALLALSVAIFAMMCCYGKPDFKRVQKKYYLTSVLTAGVVSLLFYSSFLTHARGPLDSLKSFEFQVKRGFGGDGFEERFTSGAGHQKPFNYYISTLVGQYPKKLTSTVKDIYRNSPARPISEIFFLLFPLVGWLNLPEKGSRSRKFFFGALVYTVTMFLVYSAIPYKTPWCLLSFLTGFMFLSAFSGRLLWEKRFKLLNKVILLVAVLMLVDLGRQSSLVNAEEFCVTDKNPYAYVQPYFDVEALSARIEEFAGIQGEAYEMPIHFLTPEYWPLPWYLKRFKNVAYWEEKVPEVNLGDLPLIITTPDRTDIVELLESTHFSEFRVRMPGYYLLVFYRNDLWVQYNNSL